VAKSFTIPALKLNMMKYKNPSATFFGSSGNEEIKPFYSKPLAITVKPLPDHPMKGNVSVGVFTLEENLAKKYVSLNQGVAFEMGIKGEGNISYIPEPRASKSEMIDVYPPNTQQTIQRSGGRVTGKKTFSYLLVPKERGDVQLGKTIFWVFFNTKTARYDTLKPTSVLRVVQGKKATAGSSARTEDSFYAWIEKADPSEISLRPKASTWLFWINIGLAAMGVLTIVLSFLRR
jgi:hypothetical protein